jgi:hypothetical protein
MKIKFLNLLFLGFSISVSAQSQVSFEEFPLGPSGVYNGSDQAGGFASNGLYFYNAYDPQFSSWNGFAVSNKIDTLTSGFSNQYSCYAGSGFGGSSKFGLAYYFGPAILKNNTGGPIRITSFQYTNSTYAGLSMKNGDAFSKKFGGPSGNDPDFFRIRVYNHFQGQVNDSADFYLADFRFSDNTQDYIVKSWRTANLNFSTSSDSLSFILQSSDNGAFGMNTPAYFCIDNIEYQNFVSVKERVNSKSIAFPNPFKGEFFLSNQENLAFQIFDVHGRELEPLFKETNEGYKVNSSGWKPGIYFVKFDNGKISRIVKE